MSSKFDSEHHCLQLRCKQMFYQVEDLPGDKHERHYGDCDTTVYWCECTQTGRGPDEKPVHMSQCSSPLRKCFEGIHSIT